MSLGEVDTLNLLSEKLDNLLNDSQGYYESFLDPTEKLAAIKEMARRTKEIGNYAFVSGNARQSESVYRILNTDPEIQMPPPDSHLSLNAEEKAIIIKWIQQGAKWKDHWAFLSPKRPDIPNLDNQTWPSNNAIDRFIQKKLALKGFEPAPEANKERLIRRVTMDLTGLPPTIPEIDAFLAEWGHGNTAGTE